MKDKLLNKELNLTEHNQKLLQKLEENIKLIEELKIQRDFHNTLIQSTPAYFVAINPEGKVMMMNNSLLDVLGYDANEVAGINYLSTFVPEDERDSLGKIFKKISTLHEKTINENHIVTKDGKKLLVEWRGVPIFEGKKFKYFVGIGINITKSKETANRLEEFQKIFAESLNEIYIFDSETYKFLFVNKGAKNNIGYSYNELLKLTPLDIKPEFNKEKFDDLLAPLKSDQENKIKFDTLHKRKNGSTYNIEVHLQKTTFDGKNAFFAIVIDTTEKKQSELLLKESEKKYKDLFEKSDDAILIIENGKFVDCNQATVRILRYNNKEELLNTHPSELSPEMQPDGKPSFKKAEEMMNIAYERGSHRFEWDHKKADGTVFPVEVLLTAITIRPKEKILHTVWRDITERKREEKKILELQKRLTSHLDNTPLGGIFWDTDFRIIDWNKSAERIFGFSKEEVLGKKGSELIVPEDLRLSVDETFSQFLKQSGGKKNTNENLTKEGKRILCEWYNVAITDTKGEVTGVASLVDDITEQNKSLKLQNAIYRISECTYTTSDMSTLYSNIHNILSELLPIKNIYIALYNEEKDIISFPYFVDEYDPPQSDKKPGKGLTEYVLRTGKAALINEKKDLELRQLGEVEMIGEPTKIWLGVPLKIRGKTIGIIVVQDYKDENAYGEDEKQLLTFVSNQIAQVIERKQSSVQLKKYSEELKEANQAKDKFFSIIAHDLKSPFQGLLGYSQILSNEFDTLSDEEKMFFINNIDNISKSAYNLLEDLLTWSRIQIGKLEVNYEVFNLAEFLNPTISLLNQTATNKDITIKTSIDNKNLVKADKNMVQTAVRNLISNAIKFTNNGGKIKVSTKVIDEFVEVTVEDNGIGMKKDILKNLFRIDQNVTTKGTANEEGTGLGLLLCKEMIEKEGGTIKVESEAGKGSKFRFTIPSYN